MTPWLIGRRGQSLAVLTTLLAVTVVWLAAVAPVLDWFAEQQVRIEQRLQVLSRAEALAASIPSLRAAASNRGNALDMGAILLPGDSDAVAAAGLQEKIQAMAAAAGLTLTAVETLPVTVKGDWHRISLRITCNAPWPVLMGLVRAIEQSPMRIFIDDAHLHSATVVARPVTLPIQASLLVYGFRSASGKTGA